MKRIICLYITIMIMISLVGCDNHNELKQDLTNTLDTIISGEEKNDIYIYGKNIGFNNENSENEKIRKKIIKNIDYKIISVEENENEAEVKLKIKTPDAYQMLQDIVLSNQENNIKSLLDSFEKQLEDDFPKKEFEVTINLMLFNNHWYIIPNDEFANAFSGGLIEQYSLIGRRTVENLLEEEK